MFGTSKELAFSRRVALPVDVAAHPRGLKSSYAPL
jgi:hypothetical protein